MASQNQELTTALATLTDLLEQLVRNTGSWELIRPLDQVKAQVEKHIKTVAPKSKETPEVDGPEPDETYALVEPPELELEDADNHAQASDSWTHEDEQSVQDQQPSTAYLTSQGPTTQAKDGTTKIPFTSYSATSALDGDRVALSVPEDQSEAPVPWIGAQCLGISWGLDRDRPALSVLDDQSEVPVSWIGAQLLGITWGFEQSP